jgi:multidrug efflux pump
MQPKMNEFMAAVMKDPAVESVAGFLGGGTVNTGRVFVGLKPAASEPWVDQSRQASRRARARPGATLYLQAVQT